jgi:uncharacterized membrane protein
MGTLTVWRFDSAEGAGEALGRLERLAGDGLVALDDAALVTWPNGARKPRTSRLHDLVGRGALGGAFWGMLFGVIFFVPLLGIAIGAAAGAATGALSDVGIDDGFVEDVRDRVTAGTSALFLLTEGAVLDRLADELERTKGHVELIHTNLSDDEETGLREVFVEEAAVIGAS